METQWISVKKRLPDVKEFSGSEFLVAIKRPTRIEYDIAEWWNPEIEGEENVWHTNTNRYGQTWEVVAWMPIPPLV